MRAINYDYPRKVTKRRPAVIYVFSDTHIPFDHEKMHRHIEECRKEKAGWIHLGDWCDFITPKDRRFSITSPPPSVPDQIDLAVEWFEPIKKQGVACLSGNHEDAIERNYGSVMVGRGGIATLLDIPYLGDMGFVNCRFHGSDTRFFSKTLFLWHGHGGGELLGSKVIKMDRLSHKFDADVHMVGHMHTWIPPIPRVIKGIATSARRNPVLVDRVTQAFAAPGYLDAYADSDIPNYVTARALYPQVIGCVRMEFGNDYTKIEVVE